MPAEIQSIVPHPENEYRRMLEAFDGAMKVNLQGENIEDDVKYTKDWFAGKIAGLLLTLKNTGKTAESEILHEQFSMDMTVRGFDELIDDVDAKLSI